MHTQLCLRVFYYVTSDRNTIFFPQLRSIPRTIFLIYLPLESYYRQHAKNNSFLRSPIPFLRYVYIKTIRLGISRASQALSQVSILPIYVVPAVATYSPLILLSGLDYVANAKESLSRLKKSQLNLLISRLRCQPQSGRRRKQSKTKLLISLIQKLRKLLVPALIISSLISLLNSLSLRTILTNPLSISLLVVLSNQVQIVPQVSKRFLSILSIIIPFSPYKVPLTLFPQDLFNFVFFLIFKVERFLQGYLGVYQF